MRFNLRLQFFYSLICLLLFSAYVWLLFLFHGPEDILKLKEITYFELGQKLTFPVRSISTLTFSIIRLAYPILLILFSLVSILFFKKELKAIPVNLLALFQKLLAFVRQEISSLSGTERIIAGLTFVIILGERLYYLFQFPIHTDEAATYFLFIQNGLWAIGTFYPIPNNHLLQNILASALTPFFPEPFWILRLPPLVFSLGLTFLGFLCLKRFSDFITAYLATGLFSFGCFTLFLSTQGRGYILLTLLSVLAFTTIINAVQKGKSYYWAAFSFISAFGFFTVPTFAYPFAICLVSAGICMLYHKLWSQIPSIILAAGTTLAGALILYAPLLLVSGYTALFGNKYLRKLTPEEFSEQLSLYLREGQGFLMGGKFGGGILFFYSTIGALALLFLFRNRSVLKKYLPKQSNLLIGFVLAASLVVYCLLRLQLMLPPPRVLFFKSFFDYLGAGLVIGVILKWLFRKTTIRAYLSFAGILVFAGFQVLAAELFLKDYPQPYYNVPALVKQIREKDVRKVYIEEPFYQLFLEYEYARFGKKIRIDLGESAKNEIYDYIVIEHQKQFPQSISDSFYQEVYRDELVRAYIPKTSKNPKITHPNN